MILVLGCGVCPSGHPDSEWTDEPKFPVAEPTPGMLECCCEPRCDIAYANCDRQQISYDWVPCTF